MLDTPQATPRRRLCAPKSWLTGLTFDKMSTKNGSEKSKVHCDF